MEVSRTPKSFPEQIAIVLTYQCKPFPNTSTSSFIKIYQLNIKKTKNNRFYFKQSMVNNNYIFFKYKLNNLTLKKQTN